MKEKLILRSILTLFLVFIFGFYLYAENISLEKILKAPYLYDSKEVEIEGEVLDILERPKGAWINLLDGSSSIGVWVADKRIIPAIRNRASHENKGDILKVDGIFFRACKEHLGQTGIHADKVQFIQQGVPLSQRVSKTKINSVILWAVVCFLSFAAYMARRISKKKQAP